MKRGGRRSFPSGAAGHEELEAGGMRRARRRRARMTRRGRLTIALPLAALAGLAWLSGPGRGALAAASRWLEPPQELRLARVEAPPPELSWAPPSVLARLPASREALEAALATASWLPQPASPGSRLWESLPAPADRPDLVTPLRIEYTVDPVLSERIFDLLDASRIDLGHVLVLDPETDELLAYASTDLERFPPTGIYPAASLIKVVTAAAVLEAAPAVATRPCRFAGSPYRLSRARVDPPRSGTEISLKKALATSNNQCFAQLAVHQLGAAGMLGAIRRFGFLEQPAPAHAAGQAEDPGDDRFALGQLGCGLAGCRITPLHAVRLAGTLADGRLDDPRWISRIVDGSGRDLALPRGEGSRRVLGADLAAKLREMMVETTRRGTARRAFHPNGRPVLPGIRVAGKTGSLSGHDPDGRYEWFIGVAPAENPRVAVAVVVVQGPLWHRSASQVSAQVFRTLFCTERACSPDAIERWLPASEPEPALQTAAEAGGGPRVD